MDRERTESLFIETSFSERPYIGTPVSPRSFLSPQMSRGAVDIPVRKITLRRPGVTVSSSVDTKSNGSETPRDVRKAFLMWNEDSVGNNK